MCGLEALLMAMHGLLTPSSVVRGRVFNLTHTRDSSCVICSMLFLADIPSFMPCPPAGTLVYVHLTAYLNIKRALAMDVRAS